MAQTGDTATTAKAKANKLLRIFTPNLFTRKRAFNLSNISQNLCQKVGLILRSEHSLQKYRHRMLLCPINLK